MHVRFLSDGSEYRSYGGGSGFSKRKDTGGIFWWTILITFLMGVATFCWFFSIMVLSHPEKPFNYRVLAKFDKLDDLRPFSKYTIPGGKFLASKELFAEFFAFSHEQLVVKNDMLKRSYIRNYKHEQPIYVTGKFEVVTTRPLEKTDVIADGWVVRARSLELEDVDVEILMPGLKSPADPYQVGDMLMLDQNNTFAAVLNVQKYAHDRLCATLMPLTYSGLNSRDGKPTKMQPPKLLNMSAYWPVSRDPEAAAEKVAAQSGE